MELGNKCFFMLGVVMAQQNSLFVKLSQNASPDKSSINKNMNMKRRKAPCNNEWE